MSIPTMVLSSLAPVVPFQRICKVFVENVRRWLRKLYWNIWNFFFHKFLPRVQFLTSRDPFLFDRKMSDPQRAQLLG